MFSSFISIWFDWVCINAGDFVVLRIDDSRNCTDVALANRGERPYIVPKLPELSFLLRCSKGRLEATARVEAETKRRMETGSGLVWY